MRVELHAGFRAIFGVVIGAGFAVSASPEKLAVRGGRVAVTPDFREGLRVNPSRLAARRRRRINVRSSDEKV
jgi:hypothetical protein